MQVNFNWNIIANSKTVLNVEKVNLNLLLNKQKVAANFSIQNFLLIRDGVKKKLSLREKMSGLLIESSL